MRAPSSRQDRKPIGGRAAVSLFSVSGLSSSASTDQPDQAGRRTAASWRKNSQTDRLCRDHASVPCSSPAVVSTTGSARAASTAAYPHSLQYWFSAMKTQTRGSCSAKGKSAADRPPAMPYPLGSGRSVGGHSGFVSYRSGRSTNELNGSSHHSSSALGTGRS